MQTFAHSFTGLKSLLSAGILAATALTSAAAMADSALSGIYTGSMHLTDGTTRDIPLALSLVLTDETVPTPTGNEYIIDGAFVVDDEGGPYTFVRVTYDIDNNRLDMKYSRPRNDPTTTAPASLRLVGNLDANGNITGNVTSGLVGQIGTFKVAHDATLTSIPHHTKYVGNWRGMGHNVRFNNYKEVEVQLHPSSTITTNPASYEFDYTPGHLGGYLYDGVSVAAFNQVVIDYLRRKILMIDPTDGISIELDIDFAHNTVQGQQSSGAWGLTTVFPALTRFQ